MHAIETIERDGYTARIYHEESNEGHDPRDWDNLGVMVCWHPDYALGDFQVTNEDGRGAVGGKHGNGKDTSFQRDDFESLDQLRRYLGIVLDAVVILPLYLYDHSGITMSVGRAGDNPFDRAGWDSSNVGWIYITRAKVIEEYGNDSAETIAKVEEYLRGEVATYDQWLTGDIYWYRIKDAQGEDACEGIGGIFGIEEAIGEVNGILEGLAADRAATIECGMHQWRWIETLTGARVMA